MPLLAWPQEIKRRCCLETFHTPGSLSLVWTSRVNSSEIGHALPYRDSHIWVHVLCNIIFQDMWSLQLKPALPFIFGLFLLSPIGTPIWHFYAWATSSALTSFSDFSISSFPAHLPQTLPIPSHSWTQKLSLISCCPSVIVKDVRLFWKWRESER